MREHLIRRLRRHLPRWGRLKSNSLHKPMRHYYRWEKGAGVPISCGSYSTVSVQRKSAVLRTNSAEHKSNLKLFLKVLKMWKLFQKFPRKNPHPRAPFRIFGVGSPKICGSYSTVSAQSLSAVCLDRGTMSFKKTFQWSFWGCGDFFQKVPTKPASPVSPAPLTQTNRRGFVSCV